MAGISYVISKSLCPIYNTCVGPKRGTQRTTRNEVDIIPRRLSDLHLQSSSLLLPTTHRLKHRIDVAASCSSVSPGSDTCGFDGIDLFRKAKETWDWSVHGVPQAGKNAKEALGEATPHVEQLLDSHLYRHVAIVPVGGTILGTIAAWAILPKIFRMFHKYLTRPPRTILAGALVRDAVPYDKSFLGALEAPVKYLITLMAFYQMFVIVAPTTIVSQHIAPPWRGVVILSFVWFLHRWKTNVIIRALTVKAADRDNLLIVDGIFSCGLFVLGGMALAVAYGFAVKTILTVAGIGGVATALAARDLAGDIFSGWSIKLSRRFSVGDTVKYGSLEGQVIERGLINTLLLSAEDTLIVIPNSLFLSDVSIEVFHHNS